MHFWYKAKHNGYFKGMCALKLMKPEVTKKTFSEGQKS